jgi:hypothetical protein
MTPLNKRKCSGSIADNGDLKHSNPETNECFGGYEDPSKYLNKRRIFEKNQSFIANMIFELN